MGRFGGLLNALGRRVENPSAAAGLLSARYSVVCVHRALRVTPAAKAGVETRILTIGVLVETADEDITPDRAEKTIAFRELLWRTVGSTGVHR